MFLLGAENRTTEAVILLLKPFLQITSGTMKDIRAGGRHGS